MTNRKLEKILALIAFTTVIIAGILGLKRETGDIEGEISSIIPEDYLAQPNGEGRFIVSNIETEHLLGYIIIESSEGFSGDMFAAVLVDTIGAIEDLKVISHQETPSFFRKVLKKGLLRNLKGTSYSSSFEFGNGFDVVSGATYTSDAIIECAKKGSRQIAESELGLDIPVEYESRFIIGIPDVALVLLYVIALIGVYSQFRWKKVLRWITMFTGLVILGFWFSVPLTLSRINLFLLGFWPDWHENLYWYILVFGFLLVLLITRKNIYCSWICPMGCIQDGLGLVGAAKPRFSRNINSVTIWAQRGVAWLAIILALYYGNPVKVNYEIFGISLSLTGATYLFVMTGSFFMASVFIRRPWCNYLCPITPVADLIHMLTSRRQE